MLRHRQTLQVTAPMLEDLTLLFESARGGLLPNGHVDPGFNCYAKAFVTVYLARLQGIAADHCTGRAFLGWARGPNSIAYIIDPHAWAGSLTRLVMDLSVNNFEGCQYFTTGHAAVGNAVPATGLTTTDAAEFDKILPAFARLMPGCYLFYHTQQCRPFDFGDLQKGVRAVKSSPTRAIAGHFQQQDILAKALLHLHGLRTGARSPLNRRTQREAWEELAKWRVDAMARLEIVWRLAWRGRTVPAPQAPPPSWASYFMAPKHAAVMA